MSGEIVVSVLVLIAPGREEEFLEVMRYDAVESRKEPGCVCFHVSKCLDERTYMFYEVYRDQTAVTNHKLTPHYKRWNDFRDSGGVERQQNTVAEGVYIGDHAAAPASPESPQPAGSPGSSSASKHGGSNYDVVREHPRRGQTVPPEGFGHPRGLAEEPIRPGTLSNFGRGGVRHVKKGSPHQVSPNSETTLRFYEGGLAPNKGPVRFGHMNIQNHDEGKGRNRDLKMAKESVSNFNGCGPLPDDGSEDPKPRRASDVNEKKNFDGLALTPDPTANAVRRNPASRHEWANQMENRNFDGVGLKPWDGAGPNPDDPVRTPDPDHPWLKARKELRDNFDGMALTPSPEKPKVPVNATVKEPWDTAKHGEEDPFNFPGGVRNQQLRPAQPLPKDAAGQSRKASTPRNFFGW